METLQSSPSNQSALTSAQLQQLRASLLRARVEAWALLENEEETARATDSFPEPMDAAELSREQGDAVLLTERARERLREIDRALAKMAAGGYGLSERSGDPIAFQRLQAVPWARFDADED
ncbi:MAG TPA: TraR/DksA C4-type zinc finger protein [Polyangia bacterium]|nr:TraR/DksA C4-type zinc finger protein [Polyangia bacterium]